MKIKKINNEFMSDLIVYGTQNKINVIALILSGYPEGIPLILSPY